MKDCRIVSFDLTLSTEALEHRFVIERKKFSRLVECDFNINQAVLLKK